MLADKLNWKKSLPYTFESRKKLYLSRYRFGDGFDMRVSELSDVNPVLIFNNNLMYNAHSKPIFITHRCFSSVPHKLKENFDKKTRKFENLFPIICSVENLQEAWFEIKSKPGNMTPGGDGIETLDGLSLDWFDKTSKKLLSGSYKYKLARRVYINKPGKNGKRPLTISSPRDKIIQKAILRVFQYIYEGVSIWEVIDFETFENYVDHNRHLYETFSKRSRIFEGSKIYEIRKWIIEPKFSHLSFGFKSNRSTHSALKLIKRTWSPIWFWSADLVKAFDKINHNRLISEIEKTIEDPKLIDELRKMINVDIINLKASESVKGLGTPQGNVLSPFLFNIYLSSLDFYIESLQSKYNREGSKIQNPEFRKRTRTDKKKFYGLGFREQTKKARFERDKAIADGIEPTVVVSKPIAIYYVRYADDMLFGFNMDKFLAKKILNDIRTFIKSDLHLDCQTDSEKSKLIHGISNLTSFLGFKIGLYPTNTSFKSKHLTRFYKLKANLKRKRVMESERYFKMQERVLSKMHRDFLNSISSKGQTLVKSSRVKEAYDHRVKIKVIHALKKSLSNLEAEILAVPLASHTSKIVKKDPDTPFHLAEQKRHNLLKYITTRWIQTAQELGSEEDFLELKEVVGEFLSPEFVVSRETYLTELEKIASKDFSEKIIEKTLRDAKSGPARIRAVSSVKMKRSVRILFPTEEYNKKLRSLGIINKNITRPAGVGFLTPLQDQDIINWFSLKASGIWNYYSCADNIWDVKQLINWKLRYSLLGTLAMKHKSSIKQSINKYSISPTIFYEYESKGKKVQSILAEFPSKGSINSRKKIFNNSSLAPIELERIIRIKVNTLNAINLIGSKCAVIGCGNDAEEIHHLRKLGRRLRNGVISTSGSHVLHGWKGLESALIRKQVPLCKTCHVKADKSEITPDNFDLKFVFDINKEV
jgi:retron-type reverse transcriptase